MCHQVCKDAHQYYRDIRMMQSGLLLDQFHSDETGYDHNEHFGKDQDEISDRVDSKYAQSIVGQQSECIFPSSTKRITMHGGHDVGIPRQILEELFEALQTALATFEHAVC